MKAIGIPLCCVTLMAIPTPTFAQTLPTSDPTLQAIWEEGMNRSQTSPLAQTLTDSVGPRLTGSPEMDAGQAWLIGKYRSWGIDARRETYGNWMRWQRGRTHIDLVEPRIRSLDGMLLAWSPGTEGQVVRGPVVIIPDVSSRSEVEQWLPSVSGKFVAISQLQRSCRPDDNWEEFATTESLQRIRESRRQDQRDWSDRLGSTGYSGRELARALEAAGAAGVISSIWPNGWGVQRVFAAQTETVPTVGINCEDYGLVFRLAENGQSPVLELMAGSEFLGEGPVFNTIAEIRGTELPNEYVMLSAHFDSWDGGSGATDNGTGTITMLEAMRILKATYPNPRRTILVGHWSGEEQGLNGSTGFAAQHPEVVQGLQALFNQDNGTGRVVRVSAQGFTAAGAHFANWFSSMPSEMTNEIQFSYPGTPSGGGSDHASFVCHGAPGFSLGALNWSYGSQTWHTDKDTFDKIVFDDLRHNATLTAMLVYLASEDTARVSREKREVLPRRGQTGQPGSWPDCRAVRTWADYTGR